MDRLSKKYKIFKKQRYFVSNEFYKHKDIKTLNPKYYCLLDGKTFNPTKNGSIYNSKNFQKWLFVCKEIFKNIQKIALMLK